MRQNLVKILLPPAQFAWKVGRLDLWQRTGNGELKIARSFLLSGLPAVLHAGNH
jgi:hypothetical protein